MNVQMQKPSGITHHSPTFWIDRKQEFDVIILKRCLGKLWNYYFDQQFKVNYHNIFL